MKLSKFLLLWLAGTLVTASTWAQGDDRKATMRVTLNGAAWGTNYHVYTSDEVTNPIVLADNAGTDSSGSPATFVQDLTIVPGKLYLIGIDSSTGSIPPTGDGHFSTAIKAPAGYTVFVGTSVNGTPTIPQPTLAGDASVLGSTGNNYHFYFQVVEQAALAPAMAGKLTRLDVSDLVFELGLGSLKAGESAGRLQLRSDGRTSGGGYGLPSNVFTYGLLNFVGPSPTGLSWQTISGGRKLETGQVKVEEITTSSTSYTVSFYPYDKSGSVYSSTALAVFTIEKITTGLPTNAPSSSDCMKITETQGGSVTVTRYVFRSTTGDSWTLIEGASGEQRIEAHDSATVSGNREETVTIKNSSLTTVAKHKRTWTPDSSAELLTKEEVWSNVAAGSADLVTTYEYYTGSGIGAGDKGLIKKITYPNGATKEYDYYDDNARLGQIYTITEPWSTGSSTSSKVTTYDYTGPTSGLKEYVSSEETKIGGVTVSKSTHSYDFTQSSPDSMPLVIRTSTHYSDSGTSIQQITSTYRKDVDYFFAGRPFMTKAANGQQQSYRYQKGTYSGGTFTAGSGDASRTWTATGSWVSGTATTSISGLVFESIDLVANQSTLTETIRDAQDNLVSEKTYIWDGSSFDTAKPIVSSTATWLDAVRQTDRTELNGAKQEWTWSGSYLATTTDSTGVPLAYAYDSVGRIASVTRGSLASYDSYQSFDAVTTTFGYDAAGRKTSETEAGGSYTRTTSYAYDAAGRVTGTTMPDGRSSSATYSFPGSNITQVAETLPSGGTRTTQTLIDGRVKQVTGTAQVEQYFSYSVDGSTGFITAEQHAASSSSGRWQKTKTDWLGRVVEQRRPGYTGQADMVETPTYNSRSQVTKISRTGVADEYRSYDDLGNLTRSGLDYSGNSSLSPSDTTDRVMDTETIYNKVSSDWWVRTTDSTYPTNSTSLVTGKKWVRLTGLATNTLAQTAQEDAFGNQTTVTTVLDRTKRRVTTTVTYPGVSASAVTVANNGFTSKMTGTDGRNVTHTYDSVGRLYQDVDSRTGTTTYTYRTNGAYHTNQLQTVIDPTSTVIATYTYDSAGRVTGLANAASNSAYYSYDDAGRLTGQWGGAVTPATYAYTSYGELQYQSTYRAGTGWTNSSWASVSPGTADTTTFTYDGPSGLLTRKLDAAGNHVDYAYNDRGLVATRDWMRLNGSGQRIRTTYSYATNSTELTGKSYNDSLTPSVSFAYNRLGQMTTASDIWTGSATQDRTFEYNSYQQLVTEKLPSYLGSRWITYTYQGTGTGQLSGRPWGYELGVSGSLTQDLNMVWAYDGATGNISSVTATHVGVSGSRVFSYSYASNTSLISGLSESTTGYSQTRNYDSTRDLLKEMTTKFSTTTKSRYDYTFNSLGQRDTAKQNGQTGSAFADFGNDTYYRYTYNSRGELTAAVGYLGTTVTSTASPLPGRNYQFAYDTAGNRTSANSTGVTGLLASFSPNYLNQITDHDNIFVPVSGTVDSAAKVVVNGNLAGQQGNYWSGEVLLSNTSTPAYTTTLAVKAAKASPETKQIASLLSAFIGPLSEHLIYDEDGNLKSDGRWTYTWDAENRLTQLETTTAAITAGLPKARLVFNYDSLGRRTMKEVYNFPSGSATLVSGVRYVYQGWNLIAELNSSGTLQRSYAWGLDLSGSFGAMGGIGALLQMVDHSGTVASYLPGYDGSGNVAAMMKSDGTISAAYEYGPFGEQLREEGTYAPTNPFRSATKYTDEESGYVYYGMRYYSPSLGRFINRDPIGEKGGVNLYAFCGNNAVNAYDYLGMDMYMTFVQDEYGNTYIEEGGPSADDLHDANLRAANNQNWMSYAEGKADGALKAVIAYENAANLRALMKSLNSSASKAMSIVAQKNQAVALGSATNLTNSFSSQLGASGAAGLANKINAGMDAANAALAGANLGAAQAIADSALHNLGRGAVVTIGTPTVISWDFAPGSPTATTGPHNTADNDGPSIARQAWGAALESGGRYAGAVVEAFKFWNLPQNIANFAGSHAASAIYDSSNYFSLSGSGAFLEQQFGTAEGWGSFLGSILAGSVVPDLSYVELPSVRAPSGTTQALAMNVAALLIDWQPAFRDGYMLPDYATMEAPNEIALFAEPIDFRPPAAGGSGAPPKH